MAEFDRGDGICCHLNQNLCSIYEQRPLICNVQKMYDLFFRTKMDEQAYIQENLKVCLKLAKETPEIKAKIESLYGQEV